MAYQVPLVTTVAGLPSAAANQGLTAVITDGLVLTAIHHKSTAQSG